MRSNTGRTVGAGIFSKGLKQRETGFRTACIVTVQGLKGNVFGNHPVCH